MKITIRPHLLFFAHAKNMMQIFLSSLFLIGTWQLGKNLTGKLSFFLANALVGYLPLFALQSYFSFTHWGTSLTETSFSILAWAKICYVSYGVFALRETYGNALSFRTTNLRKTPPAVWILFFVTVCLPSLPRATYGRGGVRRCRCFFVLATPSLFVPFGSFHIV